jgi:hypothetical protein
VIKRNRRSAGSDKSQFTISRAFRLILTTQGSPE